MKILLTADPEIPVPPTHYGGIERIIDLLGRSLVARGHQVGLVAHEDSTCPVNWSFHWPGGESQKFRDLVKNTRMLSSVVSDFRPDIIHSFSRLAYMAAVLPRSLPKVMSYQRNPSSRTTRWAARLAGKSLVYTGCSEHICVTGRRGGGEWIPIPNGVELEKYPFVAEVSTDAPLLFLSRIEKIKGTAIALDAANAAGRGIIIAGNIPDSNEAKAYWSNEIEPRLKKYDAEYVGPVGDRKKAELLGGCSAMIVPVQWDEPFGIVFAEALACGTPVISTPRGSLPEIVKQGIHGFLCHDLDEMKEAILNLRKIDRTACRRRVEENYSMDVIVDQYEEIYRRMAGHD